MAGRAQLKLTTLTETIFYRADYLQSAVQHHGQRLCVRGLQRQTESCRKEREGQADLLGESNTLFHLRHFLFRHSSAPR